MKMVKIPKPGRTWYRFERECIRHKHTRKFFIQEVVEDTFEDVIQFLNKNYYLGQDPLAKAANELEKDSKRKYMNYWRREILPQKLSLVCVEDKGCEPSVIDSSDIIGVQLFERTTCNPLIHRQIPQSTSLPAKVSVLQAIVNSKFDLYKTYNVDEYLKAVGSCVRPEYIELNISEGMLKASQDICKLHGLQLCAIYSWFQGHHTLAQRAGFRTLVVTEAEELEAAISYKFSDSIKQVRVMTKFMG